MKRTLSILSGSIAAALSLAAQTEPNPGPGVGNLTYTDAELMQEISRISPYDDGPLSGTSYPYGYNLAHMVNGYLATVFAQDGGGVRGDIRGGIQFYDVSNPRAPRHVKTIWDPSNTTSAMREIHAICVAEVEDKKLLLLPSHKGIQIWDVTDINAVSRVSLYEFLGGGDYTNTPWQLHWQHPYVYVAAGGNGLHIIDVSDIENPTHATRPDAAPNPIPNGQLGGFSIGPIWAWGNRLLVTSMETSSGFSTLDISDPLNPSLLDTLSSIPERYYAPGFDGKTISFATRASSARTAIYSIDDEGQILLESHANTPVVGSQLYTSSQDEFVYLGCQAEIVKLDISDPKNPTIAARGGLNNVSNPDFGQAVPFGNVLFVGNDHGTGTGFIPSQKDPDTRAPEVIATSPANGQTNLATTSRIGIAFSDNIELESLNTSNISVQPLDDQGQLATAIDGTFSLQFGIVNFTPASPLTLDTTYLVTLRAGGVNDWAGNALANDLIFAFRTGNSSTPTNPEDTLGLQHSFNFNGNTLDSVATLNGTLTNGATLNAGKLSLDGNDDYLALPDALSELQSTSSLSFHLTTTSTGANNSWQSPGVTGVEVVGSGNDIFWGWLNPSGHLCISVGDQNPLTTSFPINDGILRHFTLTRDASTGDVQIFINGQLNASANKTSGDIGTAFSSIGRIEDTGSTPENLQGSLDNVRVFNYVLTPTQVLDNFYQSQASSPLHQWLLSGDLNDSISGLHASATGTPTYTASALTLNGSTDQLLLADSPITNDWTLSLFVTPHTYNASTQKLFSDTSNSLLLNHPDNPQKLGIETSNGTQFWNYTCPPNQSTHLVFSRQGNTTQLYANGIHQGALSVGIDLPRDTIGARAHATLDDIQIFDSHFTQNAVQQLRDQLTLQSPQVDSTTLGSPSQFSTQASSAVGEVLYTWDFGDGTQTQASTSASTTHTYSSPGHYTISVHATDGVRTLTSTITTTIARPTTSTPPTRSNTLTFHPDNQQVYCVNIDNNSITAMQGTFPFIKLWEAPTGKHPRSIAVDASGLLWVANKEDATLTVHDPSSGTLLHTHTLPYASRPHSFLIAPDKSFGYLSLEALGQVAKINLSTGAIVATTPVGPMPRGLAMTHDNTRLFVTRFISPDAAAQITELDPSSMTLTRQFLLPADSTSIDDSFQARGVPNYLPSLTVSPDGTQVWIPSKKDNIFGGTHRDGTPLDFQTSIRPIASTLDINTNTLNGSQSIDFNDVGMPSDIEFSQDGGYAFVTLEASNQIEIRDSFTGNRRGGVDNSGLAPRSLISSPDGSHLFVHHFMSRDVKVYDISEIQSKVGFNMPVVGVAKTVSNETLTPTVLKGKQLFYNAGDARMAKDAYISCAACHDDGGHDGRTWDFTQRGEGLRNTTTLRGRSGTGHGRVHWTGNFDEIQDFEHDIRNNFGGTGFIDDSLFNTGTRNTPLGDPKAGLDPDLDALAAYVNSLTNIPPSPHRNQDGSMTHDAIKGKEVFTSLRCYTCHDSAAFTDSPDLKLHNVGTALPSSGQRLGAPLTGFDTPTLKGIWNTAPYLHDGSAATLDDLLTTRNPSDQHGAISTLTPTQRSQLIAYLQQLDASSEQANAYDRWKHDQFTLDQVLAGSVSHTTSDSDQDGLNNFTEYFFGSNPNNATTTNITAITPQADGSVTLTFSLNIDALTLADYQVETSTDLLSWTPTTLTTLNQQDHNGTRTLSLQAKAPNSNTPHTFYRLTIIPKNQ
ncbi:LamG-like jellyroll fold domain-containing protein [Rubritalea tangerina]|uniref:LamG-like jellyroll fold domain-containing protein n=1 Tax=Rubritalea tangerina TaxID=430798 RepID=A0ABW4ZF77_9BACT